MSTPIVKANLEKDVQYFEYSRAANPVDSGSISAVPFCEFLSELHETGATRIIPLDLSKQLVTNEPATSPNLAASFLRIESGKKLSTSVNATSQLFFVIRGRGTSTKGDDLLEWKKGDFFVLPGSAEWLHSASEDSAIYWVSDAPLLHYLGATATTDRFMPTLYKAEDCERELARVANDPHAKDRNRVSVLLANKNFPQTMTVTHTLWAMFGLLPKDSVQPPHRHNSVALDLILDCKPGCYTLISRHIDEKGNLINPKRQDWKPNSVFVTPPYLWHSHHNESGENARLIPIQDAGIQTYMRTLNIEFAHPDQS